MPTHLYPPVVATKSLFLRPGRLGLQGCRLPVRLTCHRIGWGCSRAAIECVNTCRYTVAAVEGQKVDTVGIAVSDHENQFQLAGLINPLVGVIVIGR